MLFDRWRQRVSHKSTLAPPGEYDWTCASFGPLEFTTETANGWVHPFLHSLRQKVHVLYNGRPYPPELLVPMGIWSSHVTHDAFGPCESITQMVPRSVQSSLHNDRGVSLYFTMVCLFPPENCPFPCWYLVLMRFIGPIRGSLGPPEFGTQMATWSFQPFSQDSLEWQTDRATERPTDHTTWCDAA